MELFLHNIELFLTYIVEISTILLDLLGGSGLVYTAI